MNDTERANLIADVCMQIGVPPPALPPATRYVKRGAYIVCCTCGLVKDYCPGHGHAPDVPSEDARAAQSLEQRIAEARTLAGGR